MLVRVFAGWDFTKDEVLLPDFDPAEDSFDYVRGVEIPKPRWTANVAKFYNIIMPEGTRMAVQDRAHASPVWYTP